MNPRKRGTRTTTADAEIVKVDSQEVIELKARLDQFRASKVGQYIEALESENARLRAALATIGRISTSQP